MAKQSEQPNDELDEILIALVKDLLDSIGIDYLIADTGITGEKFVKHKQALSQYCQRQCLEARIDENELAKSYEIAHPDESSVDYHDYQIAQLKSALRKGEK